MPLLGNLLSKRLLALAAAVTGIAAIALIAWPRGRAHSAYVPRSAELRRPDVFLYPSRSQPPVALVLFFGNDVGFWDAHQEIAQFLAASGYAVVGLDVRPLLAVLPDSSPERRGNAIAESVDKLIAASAREYGVTGKPLVLMGHSLGAEFAIWAAAHLMAAQPAGVVAISPRSRGHLRATLADIANRGEPHEPGSFSLAELIHSLPGGVRVAIVRGDHDKFKSADSALVAAGGARVERLIVPFAAHSLKSVFVARYVVRRAVRYATGGEIAKPRKSQARVVRSSVRQFRALSNLGFCATELSHLCLSKFRC